MKCYIFLLVAWTLLGVTAESYEIHQAYVAMLGSWVGMVTLKIKIDESKQ